MKVLIAYATHSGSSFEVAEFLNFILAKNHQVTMLKANLVEPKDWSKYDVVVLGSGSWKTDGHEGYPQPALYNLLLKAKYLKFKKTKFALFGCGDNSYTQFCGAVDYLEDFVKAVEGKIIVDSLRVDSFFFDLKNNAQFVEKWALNLSQVLNRF